MKNKFYAVTTKCGHVGKNNYIKVIFPINAESGKEAAEIARWMPRVKHHMKDAIINVNELTFEEYEELLERNSNDPYLKCQNVQEQNRFCTNLHLEIEDTNFEEYDDFEKRMARKVYKQRKNKIIEHDIKTYFKGLNYDASYVF